MSHRPSDERINQFFADRKLLLYTDSYIAKMIGVDRANYSNYMTGKQPITIMFLQRFYGFFGDEIQAIKDSQTLPSAVEERLQELHREYDHLRLLYDEMCQYIKKPLTMWHKN